MDKFPSYSPKDDKRRVGCIKRWLCAECGERAKRFREWVSREEYFLSGRCQGCQDLVFDREDDEYVRA